MSPLVRRLGLADYVMTREAMRAFDDARLAETPDEFWVLEHPPVFTQGQAGKPEHVLFAGDIPVVATDRGGQVTYHGPGQLVLYPLVDIARRGLAVRAWVTLAENALLALLKGYGIPAYTDAAAPGIYVDRQGQRHKIASLGFRVRQGRSQHGVALNVAMDLAPFTRINPCGFAGLPMTQLADLGGPADMTRVSDDLLKNFLEHLETHPVRPLAPYTTTRMADDSLGPTDVVLST